MGISPHTISLVLNHVTARQGTITSKVYVQYSYDREKREALNAWGTNSSRLLQTPRPKMSSRFLRMSLPATSRYTASRLLYPCEQTFLTHVGMLRSVLTYAFGRTMSLSSTNSAS